MHSSPSANVYVQSSIMMPPPSDPVRTVVPCIVTLMVLAVNLHLMYLDLVDYEERSDELE